MTTAKNKSTSSASPAPKKQKRSRRRPELVRARVLEAALHNFAASGFEGASVRSIASEADVSLSLLLYHFESKEKLWRALVEDLAGQYSLRKSEYVNEEGLSAGVRLERAIEENVRLSAEKPELHRFMTSETSRASSRLAWICDVHVRDEFDYMVQLIEAAQAEGVVRDINPERLRFAIVAMSAVPFAVSAEYEYLTDRNPFKRHEIDRTIQMIHDLVFV